MNEGMNEGTRNRLLRARLLRRMAEDRAQAQVDREQLHRAALLFAVIGLMLMVAL